MDCSPFFIASNGMEDNIWTFCVGCRIYGAFNNEEWKSILIPENKPITDHPSQKSKKK